ncbi:MAG: hypothetical protein SGCHY_002394 [Lobulomycetales sp.]
MSASPTLPRTASRKNSLVQSSLDNLKRSVSVTGSSGCLQGGGQEVSSMVSADYELGKPIGFGSSAVVYIALYKPLNKNVAIKMIDLDMFERNQIDELRREIQIMSLSKHQNLLPVHGSFVNESKLYIVTPFLSAGSCLDIMKTAFPDGFEEAAIATLLKQALQGIEYLHKNGLIHRDVKAGNLLVADDGLVQLADFGVSSSLMETGERKGSRKTFVGTPCWMAPEVMEQSGYDYKADIWSFGITALELATGHAPFAKFPPMKNEPPSLDREQAKHRYSKSFKDMIDLCLQKDPTRRPTAEKLLQHPFFKQGKKPSYLVQSILQNLGPVQHRAHNKKSTPQKKESMTGESWDFSTEDASESLPLKNVRFDTGLPPTAEPESFDQPVAAPKKSRFVLDVDENTPQAVTSVLVQGAPASVSSIDSQPASFSPSTQQQTASVASGTATDVRRGRFTVSDSQPNMSSQESMSNISAVATGGAVGTSIIQQAATPDSLKSATPDIRGRFEVTTNDNQDESPASPDSQSASQTVNSRFAQSPASEPATILYTDRIDLLIKQNELQRQMILEMVQSMPSKTESATNFLNGASSLEWTPQTSASSSSDISTVKNLTDSTVESREFQSFADVSQHAVQTDRMMGTLISQERK